VLYPTGGGVPTQEPTPCDSLGTEAKYVAVDPTQGKHLLYSNCADTTNSDYVLIDGGSDPTTTADDSIIDEDPMPRATHLAI
jgi:hypothetical protein